MNRELKNTVAKRTRRDFTEGKSNCPIKIKIAIIK